MEDLYLKKTFNSPEVEFIADKGELSLEGRSIPDDPGELQMKGGLPFVSKTSDLEVIINAVKVQLGHR